MAAAGSLAAILARKAAGTGVILAQGTFDVAIAKGNSIKNAAMDRIGDSTGGRIAAAIKTRAAEMNLDAASKSQSNSLSPGEGAADLNAEVEMFRDRDSRAY